MTDKQLEANRANAKKSTGPRSEAGKKRSSLNGRRHSLTGKIHIATPEESAAFDAHCQAYRDALDPSGIIESDLAQEIAEDRWRLKRARSLENSIFAQGHHDHVDSSDSGHPEIDGALAEGKTWVQEAHNLQLLTLYENRIRRAIEKNTAQLEAIQERRKKAYERARYEAIQLVQLADFDGEEYDPTPDFTPASAYGGFVFSMDELYTFVDRNNRLNRASRLPKMRAERASAAGQSAPEVDYDSDSQEPSPKAA
jgi:hypothetical protein